MPSLYEFLTQERPAADIPGLPGPRADSGATPVQALAVVAEAVPRIVAAVDSVSATDAKQLGKELTQLIQGERFLRALSNRVGVPKPGESEDQFVARGQRELRSLLEASLKDMKRT